MNSATEQLVHVWMPNDLFHAHEGRVAVVVKSFWRNGESWYRLRDGDDVFDSPDVFWQEIT